MRDIVTLLVIIGLAGAACGTRKKLNDSVRETVLQPSERGSFNGSILVARGSRILVQQHYGFVDLQRSAPISEHSRFNIGSAAKEVAGFAVLHLIREGKIRYSDPVSRFLPDLPAWADRVSVQDLIFYRSGLPNLNFYTSTSDANTLRDLRQIEHLLFEPGSDYLYSNLNNFLQAQIVASVTGVDYQRWVEKHFFEPLRMDGALFAGNPPGDIPNLTKAYSARYGDDILDNPQYKHFDLCYAPIYMTPADLFKWISYVQEVYEKGGAGIAEFFRETSLDGQGALGVIRPDEDGSLLHEHGGYAYSFGTLIHRQYRDGLTVITMTNSDGPAELKDLTDSILATVKTQLRR
ncbi:serine hydrolase domain-containing protein [Flavilitoribacter nigricans]|uniref:Beta-lactamase-related domain-containing protein n=1 Tax=Flavilitoribacter nigricans (strain ATCC 23147 / DSM 23189 / NBRC 102662 / NCIMB 1420 / SS-2) TaxID=1122177 RepID=A0A2D0N9U8_FLAN2|nr:serine hydrolase domain-containing protein [Flavilitoribacter nigricans]PHN05292.1 hypothetical protein CRP01_17400 [Flavilitoribacter nigricans DSM 23189 = NBRC 102662]